MQTGMYVRVPIKTDPDDLKYPRTFALGQVVKVNPLSETAVVMLHDLFGCMTYYEVLKQGKFPWEELVRCKASKGSTVKTPLGEGTVQWVVEQEEDELYSYYVKVPPHGIRKFPETEIQADFTAFDLDPAEMLMRYEFQHPSWFACRNVVSRTMHILNHAVYGFKVLAGCRIFLLPHQIVTIARCLQSQPMRYMLADEVGLGKTVEACAIIKIMQERNPSLRVLYLLPESLLNQWQYELLNKFALSAVPYQSRKGQSHVHLTYQELKQINLNEVLSEGFHLLVVDETHHLLEDAEGYQRVLRLSQQTEHILLLSATPIQDRKEEYLRLLRLLDPEQYNSMSVSDFAKLVDRQQEIQRELYLLMGDLESYEDYAESVHEQLHMLAETLQDDRLLFLVKGMNLESEDRGKGVAYQAAAYICEHYRLERHVIRNRRALLNEKLASREMVEVPYDPSSRQELYGEYEALEDLVEWLNHISDGTTAFVQQRVVPLLEAAFSSPWALQARIHLMQAEGFPVPDELMQVVESWVRAADEELQRVDELLDENPHEMKGRIMYCLDYLEQETDLKDKPFKVLVFTQFRETLEKFLQTAQARWGEGFCRAFYSGMTQDGLQDSAEAFQHSPSCKVLVCDEIGSEGRNFQMADIVVHLDTPWSANALEQRIGRLDRLGRDPEHPVVSVVFYARDTIEEQLVRLWKEGMKIYHQSLSGLEIVTGEITRSVYKALQEDVRRGLFQALPAIEAEASRMREAVEEEQFYDITSMLYRPLTVAVECLLEMYQGKENDIFFDAMASWAAQAGFRPTQSEMSKGPLIEFRQENFSPRSSANAFMVPPAWQQYTLHPKVKRQGRIIGTFDRALAIQREDLLFFGPGDPIFDCITENAMNCYRGRVCALAVENGPFSFNGLIFIWNVEPNVKFLLDRGIDPIVLAEFRIFLPMEQILTPYPLSPEYGEVGAKEITELLQQRNLLRKAIHLGRRKGHSQGLAPIQSFMEHFPRSEWEPLISQAKQASLAAAHRYVQECWDIETAREEANRIVSAYQASNLYFGRGLNHVEKVKHTYQAVLEALENYQLLLDAAVYMVVKKS